MNSCPTNNTSTKACDTTPQVWLEARTDVLWEMAFGSAPEDWDAPLEDFMAIWLGVSCEAATIEVWRANFASLVYHLLYRGMQLLGPDARTLEAEALAAYKSESWRLKALGEKKEVDLAERGKMALVPTWNALRDVATAEAWAQAKVEILKYHPEADLDEVWVMLKTYGLVQAAWNIRHTKLAEHIEAQVVQVVQARKCMRAEPPIQAGVFREDVAAYKVKLAAYFKDVEAQCEALDAAMNCKRARVE